MNAFLNDIASLCFWHSAVVDVCLAADTSKWIGLVNSASQEALLFFVPAFVEVARAVKPAQPLSAKAKSMSNKWVVWMVNMPPIATSFEKHALSALCCCALHVALNTQGTATFDRLPLRGFSWSMRGNHLASYWHHLRPENHRCLWWIHGSILELPMIKKYQSLERFKRPSFLCILVPLKRISYELDQGRTSHCGS